MVRRWSRLRRPMLSTGGRVENVCFHAPSAAWFGMTPHNPWLPRFVGSCLAAIFSCVLAAAPASATSPMGTLEGQLNIGADTPVQLDDLGAGTTRPDYASFILLVRSADDGKHVLQVTPDQAGKYRVALPPGHYVAQLQQRGERRPRTPPQKFVISPNAATRVDIAALPDIRKAGPDNLHD